MTKDELIARLRSLGEQLNRDVSLTGTKEELALRVACNQVNHLIPTRVLVKGGEITCKMLK
ncbi:TPA: hypothetical protein GFY33_27140 [Escherichia coli]|nr:hypothetical protein [Escherichia coli]